MTRSWPRTASLVLAGLLLMQNLPAAAQTPPPGAPGTSPLPPAPAVLTVPPAADPQLPTQPPPWS
ncbi:MAG: hypothetical protein IT340_11250 [Chloroflexi bacterium]|nr:hypothetical protein [Chloroflexota bacterium]